MKKDVWKRGGALLLAVVLVVGVVAPLSFTPVKKATAQASEEETSSLVATEKAGEPNAIDMPGSADATKESPTETPSAAKTALQGDQTRAAAVSNRGAAAEKPEESPLSSVSKKTMKQALQGTNPRALLSSSFSSGTLTIEGHVAGSLASEIAAVQATSPFTSDDLKKVVIAGEAFTHEDCEALAPYWVDVTDVDISQTTTQEIASGDSFPISIETVELPKTLTSIGDNVFLYSTVRSITGLDNVVSIGEQSFSHCKGLKELSFPSLTSMGDNAFFESEGLVSISLPLLETVPNWAFYGCSSLTSADCPVATVLKRSAFQGCTNLLAADFPLVTDLWVAAFYGCSSLQEAYFPHLEELTRESFGECTSLQYLYLGEIPTWSADWTSLGADVTFLNAPSNAVLFYNGVGDPASIGWLSNESVSVARNVIRYDQGPESLYRELGYTAVFSLDVPVDHVPNTLSYAWTHDGTAVAGADPSLVVYPVEVAQGGTYQSSAIYRYQTAEGEKSRTVPFYDATLTVGPLSLDPPGPFTIKKGETATTVPSYAPVGIDPSTLWTYDRAILSATFTYDAPTQSGVPAYSTVTFKGLKAGTTTVTYSAGGRTVSATITVTEDVVPQTDFSYTVKYYRQDDLKASATAKGALVKSVTYGKQALGSTVSLSPKQIDAYRPTGQKYSYADGKIVTPQTNSLTITSNDASNVFEVVYRKQNSAPVVTAVDVLHVQYGVTLTQTQFLQAIGAQAYDKEDGAYSLSRITIADWMKIKWGTVNYPGTPYQVVLTVADNDGAVSNPKAVVVFIHPQETKITPIDQNDPSIPGKAPSGIKWGKDPDRHHILYKDTAVVPVSSTANTVGDVQTGDTAPLLLAIAFTVLLGSGVGVIMLHSRKRKRERAAH